MLALLDSAFAELALLDPERHIRLAIAGYPRVAIVDGLGIFHAKKRASTLPDGVDARYLLGIVKNVSEKRELEFLAEELFDRRTEMRDSILAPLIAERDLLLAAGDIAKIIATCVDNAFDFPKSLERRFWLDALGAAIVAKPVPEQRGLFISAGRRIAATFSAPAAERQDALPLRRRPRHPAGLSRVICAPEPRRIGARKEVGPFHFLLPSGVRQPRSVDASHRHLPSGIFHR